MGKNKATLEMHEHSYISGPNARWAGERSKLRHSHEGGDRPHEHEHTGPSYYTIDKDDWYRRTGLRGGGRKQFTVRATGLQLPVIETEPMQFDVIFVGAPGSVDGAYVPERLKLESKAVVRSVRVINAKKVA
ncbi:MAG TPA: hypothetical protein VGG74_21020 [Kofleriaceae bacterium]|jgi:hypothetical protein